MNDIIILKKIKIGLVERIIDDYYDRFKDLSDPIRLDILGALKENEMSAGDIAERFSLKNSKV